MKKELVVVVIPIHLKEPSEAEKISLNQTFSVLNKYPIVFMAPSGLDTSWYTNNYQAKGNMCIERFDWSGYEQYALLQGKSLFYKRFLKYEYLLTCHLDAFVFRDDLKKYCTLNYDYIGSVIYNTNFVLKDTFLKSITGYTNPDYFGNGGFSLKRVSSFYHITLKFKWYFDVYHWQRRLRKKGFYDDLFHSLHYPKLSSDFKIAPKNIAQKFGADFVKFNEDELPFSNADHDSLPFGIHGWILNNPEYWKFSIRNFGHKI